MREHRSGNWSPELSLADQDTLHAIAYDTLQWCVQSNELEFSFEPYKITAKLENVLATFVTLKIKDALRGCIGSLTPEEQLYRSVHNNTINAAMHDPRFTPLHPQELPQITTCISILSPIRDINGPEEFIVGQHGIIIAKGGQRAVFLPEVAIEQNWTREDTLNFLSQKAGLPTNAWRSGATFQVFESVALLK